MRPKIFVTNELLKPAMDLLNEHCDVELHPDDRILTQHELIEGIKDKDALLCLLTQEISQKIIDSNPNLKVIANVAVGYNNIDVNYATSKGIPVTNTPGVLTDTTADLAFTLLAATSRRISEAERFLRAGQWEGWGLQQFLGHDIHGKTLGIVGFGRIGQALAKRALGFNMKIIYSDTSDVTTDISAQKVDFETLLKESDFISIHVPLLKETTHLFSTNEFSKMKDSAIIINTSRGPVIDEQALTQALKNKEIGGAGIDVYEHEPEIHPDLLKQENATLIPHLGSATVETRTKMALMAATNLVDALKGKMPLNIVNQEVWKND